MSVLTKLRKCKDLSKLKMTLRSLGKMNRELIKEPNLDLFPEK